VDAASLNSGTVEVREAHRFDVPRLEAWMAEQVPGFCGPLAVEQFKGGQSNPTYKLSSPSGRYVMRRKPPGLLVKSAHAVDREFRVLAALHSVGFPVPRPFALCRDEAVIGTWFYVMEFTEGRIFWDPALGSVERAERPAYFDAMNETLARLHSLDHRAIGLEDYGRSSNYFERQIARWTRQYQEDVEAGRIAAMDRLVEWLPANIPAQERASLVHGDFRCDNLIFHPVEPRVIAVLDWELSTIGDPLADFAYHLMVYRIPPEVSTGFAGLDLVRQNLPSEADYVAAYCRRTGRDSIPDLNFYIAFSMFRLAAILHGIKGRVVRGTAASAHAREMAARAEPLAETAWAQAQRVG